MKTKCKYYFVFECGLVKGHNYCTLYNGQLRMKNIANVEQRQNKGRPNERASWRTRWSFCACLCVCMLAFMEQNKTRMKKEIELNVESTIAKAFGSEITAGVLLHMFMYTYGVLCTVQEYSAKSIVLVIPLERHPPILMDFQIRQEKRTCVWDACLSTIRADKKERIEESHFIHWEICSFVCFFFDL